MSSFSRTIVTPPGSTVIALVAIVIAGMLNVPYPFNGDQALFTLGAKVLAGGGVLYRDFWDLKQPGIYWFYHAAGALFGYTEIGIHIAEMLWFVALAICVSVSMRNRFRLPWMSDICVLLTVGVYFAVCSSWHLTQLEGLVSFPILLCIWLVTPTTPEVRPTPFRLFLFGLLMAVIALLKLLLIAIPLLFLLIWVMPRRKSEIGNAIASIFLAFSGLIVALVPMICYFAAEHQLPLLYKTFFLYPPRIVAELPMNKVIVLMRSSRWFLLAAAPMFPLCAIALVNRLRKLPDRFTLSILVWIALATVLVLIQHMWWEYHFLLILFPLGIAATMGLEDLFLWLQDRSSVAIATILLLVLLPYVWRSAHKAIDELRFGIRQNLRTHISPDYANALAQSQWLSARPAGEIYVMGDPLITFLSGQKQSISINGWSPEFLLSNQWNEIAGEIELKKPRYIFIAADAQVVIDNRGQSIKGLIASHYAPAHADDIGTWYLRLH